MKQLFFILTFLPSICYGHLLVQGVGTQSVIKLSHKDIQIEFNVGFSPTAGFLKMVKIDSNHDDMISFDEAKQFVNNIFKIIKPQLSLQFDKRNVDLKLISARTDSLIGRLGQHSFDVYYVLKGEFHPIEDDKPHILELMDNTFSKEVSSQISWFPSQKEPDILFRVIKPETEKIINTLKAIGRETIILLGRDPKSLDAWIENNSSEIENYNVIKKPPVDIFQELTRDQLPAAELIINRTNSKLRILAAQSSLSSEWKKNLKITSQGKQLPCSFLGSEPFRLDSSLTIHTFTIDTSSLGDNVDLSISVSNHPIKEFRLQKQGHDPSVRWSILSPYIFINKGFFSVLGPKLEVQWKVLNFVINKDIVTKKSNKKNGKFDPMLRALHQMKNGTVGFFGLVIICLLVFFQGIIHAFAPGHGKSLVAAYLAGKQGRIRDAVTLGAIVTFTHLASVYILALGGLALIQDQSQSAYKDQVVVGMQLVSAVLLFILGVFLFRRALNKKGSHHHHHHHLPWQSHTHEHGAEQQHEHDHDHEHDHEHDHDHEEHGDHDHEHDHEHGHDHEHDHEHGHDHEHEHDHDHDEHHEHEHGKQEEPPRFKQLFLVGITGGIVPCPAGLTAVFVAWYLNLFWTALLLLFFLSIGLGGSLIAIGISVVLARKLIEKRNRKKAGVILVMFQKILRVLPVFSAAFIACLGIFLFYITLKTQGEIIAGILRSLADSL